MSRDQLTLMWPREPLQGTHSEGFSKSLREPLTYNGMGIGMCVHDEVQCNPEEARRLCEQQLRGLTFKFVCVDEVRAPLDGAKD